MPVYPPALGRDGRTDALGARVPTLGRDGTRRPWVPMYLPWAGTVHGCPVGVGQVNSTPARSPPSCHVGGGSGLGGMLTGRPCDGIFLFLSGL